MQGKIKFNNLITLSLIAVAALLFIRIGATFFDLRGVTLFIILPTFFSFYLILTKKKVNLLIKHSKWILLTIAMLTVYYLASYGDSQLTLKLILNYLFSLSIFIVAFYAGLENRHADLTIILKWLILLIVLLLIPLFIDFYHKSEISKQFAKEVYSTDYSLIIVWPTICLLASFSLPFIMFEKAKYNRAYLILYIVILLSLIISSYTAVILLILFSIMGYFYLVSSKTNFFKRLFIIFISLFFLLLLLFLISSGYFGELGGSSRKINSFLSVFTVQDSFDRYHLLNIATSGRWGVFEISIKSFQKSPIYGMGYSWNIVNPVSSLHSSILDNLAYFGLLSGIIFMIYFRFLMNSYHLAKSTSKMGEIRKNSVFFGILLGFLLINLINPYFYFNMLNEIIFLIGGWVSGSLLYNRKQFFKLV